MVPVSTMCRTLGVSRAGSYAWLGRAPSARASASADAQLTARIEATHKASRATYGAPRVHAELIDEGVPVGRKRVERLMRAAGLVGVSRRKGAGTTLRDQRVRPACDLVDRNFHADEPDRLWVADITYVPTWAGFLYLAVVLDAFSRRIVGWAMGHDLKAQLVLDALNMALTQRRPVNVIHHSDQESQYTSIAFGLRCKEAGVRPSMGRRLRMRAARPSQVPHQGRGPYGRLPVHRGLVQPRAPPFRARLPIAHQLRKERPSTTAVCKPITVHQTGGTPTPV